MASTHGPAMPTPDTPVAAASWPWYLVLLLCRSWEMAPPSARQVAVEGSGGHSTCAQYQSRASRSVRWAENEGVLATELFLSLKCKREQPHTQHTRSRTCVRLRAEQSPVLRAVGAVLSNARNTAV